MHVFIIVHKQDHKSFILWNDQLMLCIRLHWLWLNGSSYHVERSTWRRTTRRDARKKSRLPELPQITTVIFLANIHESRGRARYFARLLLFYLFFFSRLRLLTHRHMYIHMYNRAFRREDFKSRARRHLHNDVNYFDRIYIRLHNRE